MVGYDQIMQRLRFVTRTRTQAELATVLEIKQSSISDAKKRHSIPSDWYMKLFENFGVNPDWLKKGIGPIYLRTEEGYCASHRELLATVLEIKQSSISDAKKRHSIPSDWYMKLFENFGVNPDWLKKGIGPIYLRTEEGYCASHRELQATNSNFLTESFVGSEIVKVYSMHSNYTKEILILTEDSCIEKIVIPKSYAKNSIIVFQTYNDESLPLVRKNSYIGIDTSSICPISGEFFAINIPYEGIVLRKIFWNQEEKRFVLRSENAEFPQISISLEQKGCILGRLCWVMQKI